MVEVLIESKAGKIQKIELRPTHSRFDENGKIDLAYAAEAMAIILGGSAPKHIDENVLDIRSNIAQSSTRTRNEVANIPVFEEADSCRCEQRRLSCRYYAVGQPEPARIR